MPTELKPVGVPVVMPGPGVQMPLSPTLARLTNTKEPYYLIQKEEPWHRQAAYFFAAGNLSAKEIAEILDKAPVTIENLLRQEWFQKIVTAIIAEHGEKDVMELFRAETFNSLVTLVQIRDDPKAPAAVRSANARDIIDRAYGKATQRMEFSNIPKSDDPVGEARRLEEENNRLSRS